MIILFFGKYPAVVRNSYNKGTMIYFGTIPSEGIIKSILTTALSESHLLGTDHLLPETIRIKHGISNTGKNLYFYYNFSSTERTFSYTYTDGVNLLTGLPVQKGKDLTLKAWDVAVIESR